MIRKNIPLAIAAIARPASCHGSTPLGRWTGGQLFASSVITMDTGAGKITIQHRPLRPHHMEAAP
jgi:Cu/Ag efflux protein CusF